MCGSYFILNIDFLLSLCRSTCRGKNFEEIKDSVRKQWLLKVFIYYTAFSWYLFEQDRKKIKVNIDVSEILSQSVQMDDKHHFCLHVNDSSISLTSNGLILDVLECRKNHQV